MHIVPARDSNSPRLVNTCLITNHVKRLVEFYEPVLALKAKKTGEEYAEFPTGVGVLAIFSKDAQEKYIPGSAKAAKNRSVVPQFRVSDVDQEYRRLQSLVKSWVKAPTSQPGVLGRFTSVTRTEILSTFTHRLRINSERVNKTIGSITSML